MNSGLDQFMDIFNKTMVDFYIGVIKRYRKELLKLSTLIVADAYFSTSTFVNEIKKEGFSLISRFRDNASTDTSLSGEGVLLYYRRMDW